MRNFRQIVKYFLSFLSLLVLQTEMARAECAAVATSGANGTLIIYSNTPYTWGIYKVRITDTGQWEVRLTMADRLSTHQTTGKLLLDLSQYSELTFRLNEYAPGLQPQLIAPGTFNVFALPNRDLVIAIQQLQLDGSYTTTVIQKLYDVYQPQTYCVDEATTYFDFSAFAAQQFAQMPDAAFADLSDYATACPFDSEYCSQPVFAPTPVELPTPYFPGEDAAADLHTQLLVGTSRALTQAAATPQTDQQKALLGQAVSFSNYFVATSHLDRRTSLRIRTAARTAQRATRRSARSREVVGAVRSLRLAYRSVR